MSAITRDWHTRNKSADPLEMHHDSLRLKAESSSRLRHGNKKYFLLGWENPWTDLPAVVCIENRAFQYRRFDIVSFPKIFLVRLGRFQKMGDWCIVGHKWNIPHLTI